MNGIRRILRAATLPLFRLAVSATKSRKHRRLTRGSTSCLALIGKCNRRSHGAAQTCSQARASSGWHVLHSTCCPTCPSRQKSGTSSSSSRRQSTRPERADSHPSRRGSQSRDGWARPAPDGPPRRRRNLVARPSRESRRSERSKNYRPSRSRAAGSWRPSPCR